MDDRAAELVENKTGLVERFDFVGGSYNEAPMRRHFTKSVGAANLRPFIDRCEALPSWIADAERGSGFCEMVEGASRCERTPEIVIVTIEASRRRWPEQHPVHPRIQPVFS